MQDRRQLNSLNSLTSLRAFAALAVLVHHTRNQWGHFAVTDYLCSIGWLGVSFFFILSGFVLMWGFDPKMRFGDFMFRRFARIYPLHFFTLVTCLVGYFAIGDPLAGYVGNLFGTVLNLLLLHGWVVDRPAIAQAWNGVSWTLSCELFFYICAVPIFRAMQKCRLRTLAISGAVIWLALLSASVAVSHAQISWAVEFFLRHPLPNLIEFYLGAVGALYLKGSLDGSRAFSARLWSLCAVLGTVPFVVYMVLHPESTRNPAAINFISIASFFPVIVLFAGLDCSNIKRWFLTRPLFILLGETSFALYMTHAIVLEIFYKFVVHFAGEQPSPLIGTILLGMYAVLSLLVSVAVFKFLEMPTRNALLSAWRRKKSMVALPLRSEPNSGQI